MKKGQVLVESLMTFPAIMLGWCLSTSVLIGWAAANLLEFELYSMARSNLYGNTKPCTLSKHWPKLNFFKAQVECAESYKGQLIIFNKAYFEKTVSLEGH